MTLSRDVTCKHAVQPLNSLTFHHTNADMTFLCHVMAPIVQQLQRNTCIREMIIAAFVPRSHM